MKTEELVMNYDLDVYNVLRPIEHRDDAAYLYLIALQEGEGIRLSTHCNGYDTIIIESLLEFCRRSEEFADIILEVSERYLIETEPEFNEETV